MTGALARKEMKSGMNSLMGKKGLAIGLSGMLADVALKDLVELAEEIDWNMEL